MNILSPYERFGRFTPDTDANLKEVVFRDRDTITGLAHKEYGDWRQWRLIADRNNIVDCRRIEPGTLLLIPDRPLQSGRFEV